MLQQRRQLFLGRLDLNEAIPQILLSGMLPEIPTQVLTRHSNTGFIAVQGVQIFKVVMGHVQGNQSRAATILGINRGTLRKKLKEFGISE